MAPCFDGKSAAFTFTNDISETVVLHGYDVLITVSDGVDPITGATVTFDGNVGVEGDPSDDSRCVV